MNSIETSLYFFVFIMVELSLLFIGISTIIGLALVYISHDKLKRWLSHWKCPGRLDGGIDPILCLLHDSDDRRDAQSKGAVWTGNVICGGFTHSKSHCPEYDGRFAGN
jgi:hypothetical protein